MRDWNKIVWFGLVLVSTTAFNTVSKNRQPIPAFPICSISVIYTVNNNNILKSDPNQLVQGTVSVVFALKLSIYLPIHWTAIQGMLPRISPQFPTKHAIYGDHHDQEQCQEGIEHVVKHSTNHRSISQEHCGDKYYQADGYEDDDNLSKLCHVHIQVPVLLDLVLHLNPVLFSVLSKLHYQARTTVTYAIIQTIVLALHNKPSDTASYFTARSIKFSSIIQAMRPAKSIGNHDNHLFPQANRIVAPHYPTSKKKYQLLSQL